MTNHLQRIQAVEKEVSRLSGATAVKEEVTKLRSEMKKLYVSAALICYRRSVTKRLILYLMYRMGSTLKTLTYELTFGVLSKTYKGRLRTVRPIDRDAERRATRRLMLLDCLRTKDVLKI